jgi:hypothetical protein
MVVGRFCERVSGEGLVDDLVGGLAQQAVVSAGVATQQFEGGIDADVIAFRDDAFGLFDHDARLERYIELGSDDAPIVQGTLLEYADRGDVGERLGGRGTLGTTAACRVPSIGAMTSAAESRK